MLKRRSHVAAGSGLPAHMVDFLIGVRRSVEEIDQLRKVGVRYNAFYTFAADRMPRAEFLALWAAHGAFLRAEANRRRIAPPDPTTYRLVDGGRAFWDLRRFQPRPRC